MPTLAKVRWPAALAVTLVLAGCSSTGARTDAAAAIEDIAGDATTASGTAVTGTTVLHAILPIDTGEGKPFADEVGRLSGGVVRVALESGWHATSLTAERDAIAAVKSGDVDLGIVPARAFHDAGVTAFDALVAPMTIDSLDLEVAVLKDPLVADMLDALQGTGLTGVGMLPGPIRHPSGITRALTTPADYAGAKIAISPSVVAERSLQALGAATTATPFEHADIRGFDGAELQASAVHGNDYDKVITDIVGNAGLWPRPLVIIANPAKIGALPDRTGKRVDHRGTQRDRHRRRRRSIGRKAQPRGHVSDRDARHRRRGSDRSRCSCIRVRAGLRVVERGPHNARHAVAHTEDQIRRADGRRIAVLPVRHDETPPARTIATRRRLGAVVHTCGGGRPVGLGSR